MTAKTIREIVQANIDEDIEQLKAYRDGYMQHASLAKDINNIGASEAYLHAALELEGCIQSLATIPWQTGKSSEA